MSTATGSIWSWVGKTPLLPLHEVLPMPTGNVLLFGKAEWHNPGGSVKDRPAALIMQRAIEQGFMTSGRHFLDSTSGNMGIAYATLGAAAGIPVHLVIPGNAGAERLGQLRALGATVTISDPLEGSDGARDLASQMAADEPGRYYYADQYSNDANWQSHFTGTGPEIWVQSEAQVTHFIAGMGTTGTLMGAGRFLKGQNPELQVVGVQPDSPLHGLEGLKHLASSRIPEIFNETIPDEIIEVTTESCYKMLRRLARKHGLLLGISSGAALVAASIIAEHTKHARIVVILPDSGLKYLSHSFWESA